MISSCLSDIWTRDASCAAWGKRVMLDTEKMSVPHATTALNINRAVPSTPGPSQSSKNYNSSSTTCTERSGADPGFIIGGRGEVPPGGHLGEGPRPPPLDPRLRALTTYITPHDKLIDLFLPRPDCTQHSTTMKLFRTVYAVLLLLWIRFSQSLSSLCCWDTLFVTCFLSY